MYLFSRIGNLKKIILKGRGFRCGSDEKMMRMWFGLEIDVVGLPPLVRLKSLCWHWSTETLCCYITRLDRPNHLGSIYSLLYKLGLCPCLALKHWHAVLIYNQVSSSTAFSAFSTGITISNNINLGNAGFFR